MATIATLQRMTAKTLSEKLLSSQGVPPGTTLAIIDVRDDGNSIMPRPRSPHVCKHGSDKENPDHIGGHIRGSTHVPSRQLDAMMPTLVRRLKDKETVVFHCALSQQRGPSAALRYLRERDDALRALGEQPLEGQTVYVLDRGFVGWQEAYGEDERLTEGYRRELWAEDDY